MLDFGKIHIHLYQQQDLNSMEKQYTPEENLNSHPFIIWVAERQKELIIGFFILVLVLLLAIRLSSRSELKTESDFIKAENDLALIVSPAEGIAPAKEEEALQSLQTIVSRYPDLQSKYDGPLAQILLAKRKPDQAAPYLERALGRTTEKELPLYAEFANISLAAGEEDLEGAFTRSQKMKDQLDRNSALYAYNLLRIAMLAKQLEKHEDAKDAFSEWLKNQDNPGFQEISKAFSQERMFLIDYIKQRGS